MFDGKILVFMRIKLRKERKRLLFETSIHILFWLFIFTAVNVDWTADWFDRTIRPDTPPPLSVLLFPFIFYANAMWAIPRYLNKKKWGIYILCFLLLFLVPELVRSTLTVALTGETDFWDEFVGRDSFLLGQPSVLWMALVLSFAYRFSKDWFVRQKQIENPDKLPSFSPENKQKEIQPLGLQEAEILQQNLEKTLLLSKPYLNTELSLGELAKLIGTTDKKLSTLLNQNMRTNFYDYVNSFRIADFKKRVEEGKLMHLSIVGLALECGFKSKSSFYRAFKKEAGVSPSEFMQQ